MEEGGRLKRKWGKWEEVDLGFKVEGEGGILGRFECVRGRAERERKGEMGSER